MLYQPIIIIIIVIFVKLMFYTYNNLQKVLTTITKEWGNDFLLSCYIFILVYLFLWYSSEISLFVNMISLQRRYPCCHPQPPLMQHKKSIALLFGLLHIFCFRTPRQPQTFQPPQHPALPFPCLIFLYIWLCRFDMFHPTEGNKYTAYFDRIVPTSLLRFP